jgi:hypothetical protein
MLVSEESTCKSQLSPPFPGERANGQDSELQTIYSFAPPAAHDQVLDKARTAYLKATGAISDETKESKDLKEDDGSNGKRKDAVGEDCPVYVPVFPLTSTHSVSLIFSSPSSLLGKYPSEHKANYVVVTRK